MTELTQSGQKPIRLEGLGIVMRQAGFIAFRGPAHYIKCSDCRETAHAEHFGRRVGAVMEWHCTWCAYDRNYLQSEKTS